MSDESRATGASPCTLRLFVFVFGSGISSLLLATSYES